MAHKPQEHRTAVITGAESGIGRAVAKMLAAEGAGVFSLDRQQGEAQPGVTYVPCDVSSEESVRAAVAVVARAVSTVDILVNNAGVGALGTIEENTLSQWQDVFDVNVFGTVRVTALFLPLLRAGGNSVIVNTCSTTASVGLTNRVLYSTSKGAIRAMTLAMAADMATEGIRVNCVEPGSVDTPWVKRRLEESADPTAVLAELSAFQPMGRLITAEEVALAICYLASPGASSTTGVSLPVDGGLSSIRL
ncbi:SDR family NAD(P)-dependent oxidoreductase [Pseudarthrobacter sp. H2]|uniref:SDR family NAD(P)-dependent oxidoreductase n=1 Tax=Pseudarthrobacter sp. H2 TaxID=3418415 RepID=UPI003CF35DCC